MALRWSFKGKTDLTKNKTLQKLVQFYVWETPVSGTSEKGTSFKKLGWSKSGFNTLHAKVRKNSGFPDKNWISVPTKEIVSELEKLARHKTYDCSFEFAVHTVKDGLNKTEGLFYFIRNAFAHGGFRTSEYDGETFYAFENRNGGCLKGRAVIKESTLLAWRKILSEHR